MTRAQKLQLRAAEIEARLAEIDGIATAQRGEALKAERTALNREMQDIPGKLAKALEAEASDASLRNDRDGDFAEMRSIVGRTSFGEFVANLADKVPHEGALAELMQHYDLDRNFVPIDLLRGDVRMAATPPPAEVAQTEQPVLMPVFAEGDAAYLNVVSPMVPNGDVSFPVLETRPTVAGPYGDSTEVAETDGTISATALPPLRAQAAFSYRRTDNTRFPALSESIRSALASGLREKLDADFIAQVVADVPRVAASAADTFDSVRKRFVYDILDARFARMESSLKVLCGTETLSDWSALFRGAQGDVSAVESLRRLVGGVMLSDHIAAAVSDKQDVVIRLGSRRDAVMPVWRGTEVIFDEITRARFGDIVLTAVIQYNRKIVRPAGFRRIEAQHA